MGKKQSTKQNRGKNIKQNKNKKKKIKRRRLYNNNRWLSY